MCHIFGFFEVLKFHGLDRFVKFKSSKIGQKIEYQLYGIWLDSIGPHELFQVSLFVKIKLQKTDDEAFVEFKFLEKPSYLIRIF